ncbi:N-acetylmuramoyl-L-alanine amidase family protein [Myroides profundi]|uniref:N-acetylmuramoyl-L-alanine amidase n=1 Tax=Myroides profundi TaxID=480520 RepID=A0AAJ4W427_MYRPR|nr:N-acetylmuramoyl-L-alanine amidase [Myroides profundi]AJH14586.1 N-acetylmuramoyl-L-alanine amidase [Myroides profundi]SEQ91562.1 N-acetylmuramoyl-L-alanine amidase [Myroides profundi]
MNYSRSKLFALLAILFLSFSIQAQNGKKFKVVLDPGHGGKDTGTNHKKNVEKDIVLAVALEVGKILEKQSDIEVFYTRKTDVFVPVKERSVLANDNNGNVFVSIHCNGVNSEAASGTETYVMGLSKNKSNLDVAKTENSVIMMEDDYKTKYAGFDPSSPESIIGLTLLQEDYIHQSIDLASRVQDGFTNDLKRKNRGVKQGPFWVLHGAFMPSILIELGFVSNTAEGNYLTSSKGQKELARSIAQGIIDYKAAYYGGSKTLVLADSNDKAAAKADNSRKTTTNETTTNSRKESSSNTNKVVFKVQIAAGSKVLALKPENFKGLRGVTTMRAGNLSRYYYGETSDYETAKQNQKVAKDKGHSSAFIVAFKDGKVITVEEALK